MAVHPFLFLRHAFSVALGYKTVERHPQTLDFDTKMVKRHTSGLIRHPFCIMHGHKRVARQAQTVEFDRKTVNRHTFNIAYQPIAPIPYFWWYRRNKL